MNLDGDGLCRERRKRFFVRTREFGVVKLCVCLLFTDCVNEELHGSELELHLIRIR